MVEAYGRRTPGRRIGAVLRRMLLLAAFVAAGVVTGRVVALLLDDPAPAAMPVARPPAVAAPAPDPPPPQRPSSMGPVRRAAAVLHAWDADRARAYARGDPAALRRLYTPGSRAGVRDRRVLQAYVERGLVVRGLRTQLLALRVLSEGRARLTVEVTDRFVGGRTVPRRATRDAGVALPWDAPTTRVLRLVRHAGDWQVASVRAA